MSPASIRVSRCSAGEAAGKNYDIASGSLGDNINKCLFKYAVGDFGTRLVDVGIGAALSVDNLKVGACFSGNGNCLDLDVILAKRIGNLLSGLTGKNGDGG